MKDNLLCPVCGVGHLTHHISDENVEYKGKRIRVKLLSSICDVCEVEQSDPHKLKLNKREVIKAKKLADGLLTGEQIKKIRESFSITQKEAAEIFGGGPVAFSKYESDDISQSKSMDILIRVSAASSDFFHEVCGISKHGNLSLKIIANQSIGFSDAVETSQPTTTLVYETRQLKTRPVSIN